MWNSKNIIKYLIIIGTMIVLSIFSYKVGLQQYFNYSTLKAYILSFHKYAGLVFVLIFIFRTLLFIFPYSLMVIIGGSLFGLYWGTALSLVASFFCATLAFFVSRYAGKGFVQKLLKGRMMEMDEKLGKHGFKIILMSRLTMLLPFDVPNYAAGLTKIKYSHYIIATMLGIIPEVLSLNYLGYNLSAPHSWSYAISAVIILILISPNIYKFVKEGKYKNIRHRFLFKNR